MPPILLNKFEIDSAASDTSTLTSPAFTPANGDVIVVKAITEDASLVPGTPTNTSIAQTWRTDASDSTANHCGAEIATTTVRGSPYTLTVSVPFAGTARWHSAVVEWWGNAILATTPATNSTKTGSASAPSATVTTVAANSVVTSLNGDWTANAPAGHAYRSSATEDGLHDKSATTSYVGYYFWQSCGAAGAQTIGMTAPASQTWTLLGIELQSGPGFVAGDDGPQTVPMLLPVLSYDPLMQAVVYPMRPWQRRFQWITQPWLNSDDQLVAATAGPPVYPLRRPVQARQQPARGGAAIGRDGLYAGTGPAIRPLDGPVRAQALATRGGRVSARAGVFSSAPQVGPPVRPLDGPVQARQQQPARSGAARSRDGLFAGVGPALRALAGAISARLRTPPLRGRTTSRAGVYGGAGPVVRPADGPVAPARVTPVRGGRITSRAGTYTSAAPTVGPPITPPDHPVQAQRLPQRGGWIADRAGTYGGVGPAVKAADGPARAQPAPARGGRVVARVGTFTAGAPQAGPPVYPLCRPVAARRLPTRGGTVGHRAGPYAGTGPQAPQLRGPVGVGRRQPPPPTRGRTAAAHGTPQGTGPPLRAQQHPVQSRPPGPFRKGRTRTTRLPLVATPPPPFTVGALTTQTASTATLAAGDAGAHLTGTTAATGAVTTTTAPTGGPT